ncbi:hypothetical protein TU86_04115 [Pseudomonas weihenstephanensis]|uniref:Plasmid stabilization protein n=1 Tax=Pseudomonas weihenstephanensis TaxID=1608994 RepID=A0A0J6IUG8_9PSED|nr:type II toxin-antitoxin system RelE/ParE family toxin [Pseudomonas weihenstephanensis]KMN15943.1 hypothetical protein TU86_04115 [Pseudomonas weihenstephanensis]
MTRQFIITENAKKDLSEIKSYVTKEFGKSTWKKAHAEYAAEFKKIRDKPEAGKIVDELKDLGINHILYRLVRQTKIVYEFNESKIIIQLLINTRRDFRSHLLKRVLS